MIIFAAKIIILGGELFELLRYRGGKEEGFDFREDMAARLMRDMLSAVHYLHSKVRACVCHELES